MNKFYTFRVNVVDRTNEEIEALVEYDGATVSIIEEMDDNTCRVRVYSTPGFFYTLEEIFFIAREDELFSCR